ncbi:MAG: histone deacetylase [bacterium]|jgi:acetoin utilization deacetylase AcuC-like enzyme
MNDISLKIIYSERFRDHDTGSHPENARRMQAAGTLREHLHSDRVEWIEPRPAEIEDLQRVHTDEHITFIRNLAQQGGGMADPDTIISAQSYEVALLSAGALLQGVDSLCHNQTRRVFVFSRPPGHHACPDRAMGFCLLNNIAIAARYAQAKYQIRHILILDWDVHHGNGTQDIFYEDDTVYFISTHQHPHYPGTGMSYEEGRGAGKGYTRNLPFSPHTRPEKIVDAVTETLWEAAAHFKPELILISAGFDGHRRDPLGNWLLEERHFFRMTQETVKLAKEYTGGKILSCLEGGYDIQSLSASCVSHCEGLMEME